MTRWLIAVLLVAVVIVSGCIDDDELSFEKKAAEVADDVCIGTVRLLVMDNTGTEPVPDTKVWIVPMSEFREETGTEYEENEESAAFVKKVISEREYSGVTGDDGEFIINLTKDCFKSATQRTWQAKNTQYAFIVKADGWFIPEDEFGSGHKLPGIEDAAFVEAFLPNGPQYENKFVRLMIYKRK